MSGYSELTSYTYVYGFSWDRLSTIDHAESDFLFSSCNTTRTCIKNNAKVRIKSLVRKGTHRGEQALNKKYKLDLFDFDFFSFLLMIYAAD